MNTVYIAQENCTVHRAGEHLLIKQRGAALDTIPLVSVNSLVLLDSAQLTSQAIDMLLEKGVDVTYMSRGGKIRGRILSQRGSGAIIRLAQYGAFADSARRAAIANSIVEAKIKNQLSVVVKYKRHDTNPEFNESISAINALLDELRNVTGINEIMGIEGASAKYYWDCFKRLLKRPDFTRREYRPAPDYVNAILNLTYAFLANEITTALTAEHLDAEIGFLHSVHYGRASLALDIIEEFRAPFADAWILSLLNRRIIKGEHFEIKDGDFRLDDAGFRKYCELYHRHIADWRDTLRIQAKKLKAALMEGCEYAPYRE
jgi:CRISPR-associated protein Cas1